MKFVYVAPHCPHDGVLCTMRCSVLCYRHRKGVKIDTPRPGYPKDCVPTPHHEDEQK